MAKDSAMVQLETETTLVCAPIRSKTIVMMAPSVQGCNLCNPNALPCPGEAVLGEDHSDIVTNLNNLAMALKDQGRLGEAKDVLRQALPKSYKRSPSKISRGSWAVDLESDLVDLIAVSVVNYVFHIRNWCSNTLRMSLALFRHAVFKVAVF